jgi:hypothetical protein
LRQVTLEPLQSGDRRLLKAAAPELLMMTMMMRITKWTVKPRVRMRMGLRAAAPAELKMKRRPTITETHPAARVTAGADQMRMMTTKRWQVVRE